MTETRGSIGIQLPDWWSPPSQALHDTTVPNPYGALTCPAPESTAFEEEEEGEGHFNECTSPLKSDEREREGERERGGERERERAMDRWRLYLEGEDGRQNERKWRTERRGSLFPAARWLPEWRCERVRGS